MRTFDIEKLYDLREWERWQAPNGLDAVYSFKISGKESVSSRPMLELFPRAEDVIEWAKKNSDKTDGPSYVMTTFGQPRKFHSLAILNNLPTGNPKVRLHIPEGGSTEEYADFRLEFKKKGIECQITDDKPVVRTLTNPDTLQENNKTQHAVSNKFNSPDGIELTIQESVKQKESNPEQNDTNSTLETNDQASSYRKYHLNKSYFTISEDCSILYRIVADRDILGEDGRVIARKGDLGGFISSEQNLSQEGNCWIGDNAMVYGNARVSGNALVSREATVKDSAVIKGDSTVKGEATVSGNAKICGKATVSGLAQVGEHAIIQEYACVKDVSIVEGQAVVARKAIVCDNAIVCDRAIVMDKAKISEYAKIDGFAFIGGSSRVSGCAHVTEHAQICDSAHIHGSAVIKGNYIANEHIDISDGHYEFNPPIGQRIIPEIEFESTNKKFSLLKSETCELIEEDAMRRTKHILYRLVANEDIKDSEGNLIAKEGDKGGWVESDFNLSKEGSCWIADNAKVYGRAYVKDNAIVSNEATVHGRASISGNARVSGAAEVFHKAQVLDNAQVYDSAKVGGQSQITGSAQVYGNAIALSNSVIKDNARLFENAFANQNAKVSGDAQVYGNAKILNKAKVSDKAEIYGHAIVRFSGSVAGKAKIYKNAIIEGSAKVFGDAQCSGSVLIKDSSLISGKAEIRGTTVVKGEVEIDKGVWRDCNLDYKNSEKETRTLKV